MNRCIKNGVLFFGMIAQILLYAADGDHLRSPENKPAEDKAALYFCSVHRVYNDRRFQSFNNYVVSCPEAQKDHGESQEVTCQSVNLLYATPTSAQEQQNKDTEPAEPSAHNKTRHKTCARANTCGKISCACLGAASVVAAVSYGLFCAVMKNECT